jgi:hypothetical protein
MTTVEPVVNRLHRLQRSEIAAVEAYEHAVALAGNGPGSSDLKMICASHQETAEALTRHVEFQGGDADPEVIGWNRFAIQAVRNANLKDNLSALEVLREGEQRAIELFEEALTDDVLPEECTVLIEATILPQSRLHLVTLHRLVRELQ